MEIILLRHGKPIIPPLDKLNALSLQNWIELYNSSALSPNSKPSQSLQTLNTVTMVFIR